MRRRQWQLDEILGIRHGEMSIQIRSPVEIAADKHVFGTLVRLRSSRERGDVLIPAEAEGLLAPPLWCLIVGRHDVAVAGQVAITSSTATY